MEKQTKNTANNYASVETVLKMQEVEGRGPLKKIQQNSADDICMQTASSKTNKNKN